MFIRKRGIPPPPVPTEEDPLPGLRGDPPELEITPVPGGPFRNILIRMPNWVGDVVMALPALRSLRDSHPDSRITILIKPRLYPIVEGEPYFDEWIPFRAKGLRELWRAGRDLARRRFDLALILPNSVSSALVVTLAGIRPRVGYNLEWRGALRLLTHTLPVRKVSGLRRIPMVDYYLALTYAVGCRKASRRIWFQISEELGGRADRFLSDAGVGLKERVIGISPGAAFGRSKQWRSDYFAEVADTLARKYRARILLLCGPGEERVAEDIEESMEAVPINTARSIIPLDLLKSVVRRCLLLVTTDSGTRHFATGSGVPLVTILGPTFHIYTETEYEKYDFVQNRLECWPCHRPICPLHHHRCMRDLTPDRVLEACERMMTRFPPRRAGSSPGSSPRFQKS
ncbi:MAG: lipopolysaccharide heptosyltransferase II [Planctomycetota bacterium]|nr:lipopolysaccharide heptosyltransferase II [Planctomycetota bacterium]